MESAVRVVIVDDDPMVSMSLKTILEADGNIEVADIGDDGSSALNLYEKCRPDVLLMDIRMKHVSGLDAAACVLEKYPDAKILLLTTFNDDEYIVKTLRIGAKGYILKQDFAAIAQAVVLVSKGQTVFGGEVMSRIPEIMGNGGNAGGGLDGGAGQDSDKLFESYGINDRELQVIMLVSDGFNNKEIADKMFLSEGTVRNYISVILEKLGLRDRTQLAVYYLTHRGGAEE
ncbi:MAG: response regulator transcription factor [Lachnospiraceae bacterium]|nr:response regulator transcription factor [Lachnospiraceae bacterium]